jgi:hypothetical protein
MNYRRIVEVVVTCSFLFTACPAGAQEIFEFYRGVRQLGMGGAYVAVVNDETSLLTNPAGLGKLRDLMFTIVDPELSGSFNDTQIATLSNASKVMDIQTLLDTLNQNKGLHWHAKAQLFPSFVGPNFGMGVLGKYSYDAEVNKAGTNYRVDYTNDVAPVIGYCFRFFDGIVKLGLDARYVMRTEIAKDIPPTSTGLTIGSLANTGSGLAADSGLIITAPIVYLPTLAVTVRDIGDTHYNLRSTVGTPRPTLQSVDAAIAFFPILGNHSRMTITGEVHGLATLSKETNVMRRVHAGLEFNIADFFFVRGGMNQFYWTAGIELASERFQLQVASYGEDIGTSTTPREDRRWVGKMAIRF